MNTTFKIELVNMKDGSVAAHKAGCSDLKKLEASGHTRLGVDTVANRHEVWADYNADFIAEESGTYDIDWKACAKHVPQGEADVVAEDEGEQPTAKDQAKAESELTRKQCLEMLAALGYDGPTSYLMPKLRQIVATTAAAA